MYLHKFCSDNKVIMKYTDVSIFVKDALIDNILDKGKISNGLYFLDGKLLSDFQIYYGNVVSNTNTRCARITIAFISLSSKKSYVWYSRLTDPSIDVFNKLSSLLSCIKLPKDSLYYYVVLQKIVFSAYSYQILTCACFVH